MDTNQTTASPVLIPPVPAPGIFGTKIPSAVAFAVGVLLFLLPFSEIKCGSTTLANKSGLDIALGNEWKAVSGGMFDKNDFQKKSLPATKEQKGQTQNFAIVALGLGLLGLLLSFGNGKATAGGGGLTGLLSAGALIGLMLDLKKNFNASVANQAIDKTQEGTDSSGFDKIGESLNNIKPTLNFTPWFYIAVIVFLVAAFFCYLRMKPKQPS
jgi:hypothetical protein